MGARTQGNSRSFPVLCAFLSCPASIGVEVDEGPIWRNCFSHVIQKCFQNTKQFVFSDVCLLLMVKDEKLYGNTGKHVLVTTERPIGAGKGPTHSGKGSTPASLLTRWSKDFLNVKETPTADNSFSTALTAKYLNTY